MDSEGLAELIELLLFARVDEDEGSSFFTGSGGAAAAMGVVVDLLGELVVDDKGEALDINSARGDVGGDEELSTFFFEGPHDLVAFDLGEVALQDPDRMAPLGKFFAEDISSIPSAGEDEAPLGTLTVEKFVDEISLILLNADSETMINIAVYNIFSVNFDRFGIRRHTKFDELVEHTRESGGEKPGGFAIHTDFDGGADLILKTHRKHLISFIKNEVLHMI